VKKEPGTTGGWRHSICHTGDCQSKNATAKKNATASKTGGLMESELPELKRNLLLLGGILHGPQTDWCL
jgi:hypothetical protein